MYRKAIATATALLSISCLAGNFAYGEADKTRPYSEVFRLGTFNRSSIEFAGGYPKQSVNFTIGQSNPANDWYGVQPAVLSSSAGETRTDAATAPRTIRFSLSSAPQGSFRLRLSVLIETASVPVVRVEINGKTGLLYLHPKLDYSSGDTTGLFYPAYSHAESEYDFPASFLKQGSNTISFQAIEQADEAVPDASFHYDAIELDHVAAVVSASSALIEPSIFFQQQNGDIKEKVEAFIRSSSPIANGADVTLTVNGKAYHQAVSNSLQVGEAKVEFWVSDFPKDTHAKLEWKASGLAQHSEQSISPKKKWTIFIVPHIHVDVGYSDYQPKVAAIQSRDIDEALDMIDKNPNFRYSLDGEWDLEQFMRTHSEAQKKRALQAIQDKKLYIPAQYANILTGFPTAETLIRSLNPSANISRTLGSPFNYANITDVPSYTWSYASVLSAAGIHYLAGGSNNDRAPVLMQGKLNESSPFWWEGPDGGKVLLWYSRIYQQMQMLFGLPPVVDAGRDTLPLFLQMYEHDGYGANETILYGTQVENTDLFPQQSQLAEKWNATYAYPHLQYSGFYDALASIQKQMGDHIPTIHGDGGPYWEDGIASDAYFAGMERWNEGRAPTSEKLATLTSFVNPLLVPDKKAIDQMWTDMVLMDEHTWDSWNSVSDPTSTEAVDQLAVKDQYAVNAHAAADFLARSSMASISSAIPVGAGKIVVFNSLGWKRTGLVAVDIDKNAELVDSTTGRVVPYEIRTRGPNFNHIQFVASDIPPVGYKVFEMKHSSSAAPVAETQQGETLENSYYRIMLDPSTGSVKSIYDKQLNHELVDANSKYRFGQYLYVTGGDKQPNRIIEYSSVTPKPDLDIHGAEGGSLISIMRTPYGLVARMKSHAVNTPSITSEIRLFDKVKKIEFVEDVEKQEVNSKEGVYFAFPFAMDHPEFNYEIQNGVVNPAKDMYPGAGHEWFSIQHWIALHQDGVTASVLPLDAPLATFGDINRGEWPDHFGDRRGTVFSYIMNNYWGTNYRAGQGGKFSFHYVVTSSPSTDAPELSHLGWEEISPLEVNVVTTQDKALAGADAASVAQNASCTLNAQQGSFLDVNDPHVLFEAWKVAEDGNGTILRLLNLSGEQKTVTVRTPLLHIDEAQQTNAVEQNQGKVSLAGDNSFSLVIHPHEIASVRLVASSSCKAQP